MLPSQDFTVFPIKACVNMFPCWCLVMNLVTSIHNRVEIKNRFISPSAPMQQVALLADQEVFLLNGGVLIVCKGSSTSLVLTCCWTRLPHSLEGFMFICMYFFHAHCTAMSSLSVAKHVLQALYGTCALQAGMDSLFWLNASRMSSIPLLFVHLHLCVYIKDYWCAAKLCLSSLSQPESSALMWAASF